MSRAVLHNPNPNHLMSLINKQCTITMLAEVFIHFICKVSYHKTEHTGSNQSCVSLFKVDDLDPQRYDASINIQYNISRNETQKVHCFSRRCLLYFRFFALVWILTDLTLIFAIIGPIDGLCDLKYMSHWGLLSSLIYFICVIISNPPST